MEFDTKRKRYILKHQSDKTLEEIAHKYHCSWGDIYQCYSEMLESGEYQQYMKEKRDERERKKERKRIFDLMWSKGEPNE